MLTKMNCTPPLGSFTAIPAGQDVVKFAVVLETSGDVAAGKHWQVALWHDMDSADGQWSAVDFEEKTINYQVVGAILRLYITYHFQHRTLRPAFTP